MPDPFTNWSRLAAAGASMTRTGMRLFETLGAANAVIAARMPIIDAAIRSPLTGDHAELALMVPEKVEAFSRAGSAAVAAWWKAQSLWMGHMQHLGGMAMRGHPPTVADITDASIKMAALAMDNVEAMARLGSTTLAPVHRKAVANARRLRRKKP